MLLAIDVGNTNVKYGLFVGDRLAHVFQVATDRVQTADEYGIVLRKLLADLQAPGLGPPPDWDSRELGLTGAILSSVVPPVTTTLIRAVRVYLGLDLLVVRPGIQSGLHMAYETPVTLGADRLVAAAAAAMLYGAPVITVAFGTATVFNVVSVERQFLGGAIAPGLRVAADSLTRAAARLPRIDLSAPPSSIGRTTQQALQAGAVYGYVGLVEGLIHQLGRALPDASPRPRVIATGGLASVVAPLTSAIDVVDPNLTLTGLRLIWAMNQSAV